jgi:sugar O-acyltransferase (sialic acid O-acetyltransferase NeuD family)
MPQESIILYGSGSSLIIEFEELCFRNNVTIIAVVKNLPDLKSESGLQELEIDTAGLSQFKKHRFLCPFFTPKNRYSAVNEALEAGLKPFPILSHKHNDLPASFENGVGCFINKGVVVGAQSRIGNYVLINRSASIGHHFTCDDFVSIGPGATMGGHVAIERGAAVGTGAVILPKVHIGKHAVIGAGAVVTKDVGDNCIVVGNPAVVKRTHENQF